MTLQREKKNNTLSFFLSFFGRDINQHLSSHISVNVAELAKELMLMRNREIKQ